jgi:hypothetical protein
LSNLSSSDNNNNSSSGAGQIRAGNNNSGTGGLTTPRLAAITLRRVPDGQGFELWVIYPNSSGAVVVPPKRSMLMAFSKDVTLNLARQIARLVAQDYNLPGFVEEG